MNLLNIEVRLVGVLIIMLLLPGSALLEWSGVWRSWSLLQRAVVAVALSIAAYPALFYAAHAMLPFAALNRTVLLCLLGACALFLAWHLPRRWHSWRRPDALEWCALFIFVLTILTRLWLAHQHPYPAWSDSLHHALLTRLTAEQGRLATSLQPYFPIELDMYHLGLYALSATLQALSGAPAHMSLHWMAQLLNGLCGLGIFLVLDRLVGRVGAVVGAATVGLFLAQPAFYVNWGRFTQVASQTILPIAWLMTVETVRMWTITPHAAGSDTVSGPRFARPQLWAAVLSGLVTAGIFLLHFRVAIFYLPLLAVSLPPLLWRAHRNGRLSSALWGVAWVGASALLFVLPVLWNALRTYFALHAQLPEQTLVSPEEIAEIVEGYYALSWDTVPYLAAKPFWLWLGAGLGVVGMLRRSFVSGVSLLWTGLLVLLGYTYLLDISQLRVTNLSAILIMLYLPLSLVIGAGVAEALALLPVRFRDVGRVLLVAVLLVAVLPAAGARITAIEPFRFFVTPADEAAMAWIDENISADARFAVNTTFWLPNAPHGTDAGYWLPYFTGHETTASAMPLNAASIAYQSEILELSRLVKAAQSEPAALDALSDRGVKYIYIGQRGNFADPGLQAAALEATGRVEVLYQRDGCTVLRILP